MRLFAVLFLTMVFITAGATLEGKQLIVEARNGDGIYSLLRRYQLVDYDCNLREFLRLNRLNRNSNLLVGRRYLLPIEVYTYDGTSIRSTTDNSDWDRAVAISRYNEALLDHDLRSSDYRKDRVLYVPYHIDHCLTTEVDAIPTVARIAAGGEIEDTYVGDRLKDQRADRDPITVPEQVTTAGPRVFKIFGEAHAEVPLLDRSLAGRIFYIVSGHGGPDPGAVGRRSGNLLAEDEYAYDVALRLCRNILQHGGTPYMIVRDENDGIRNDRYLQPDRDETVWGGGLRYPAIRKGGCFNDPTSSTDCTTRIWPRASRIKP